jgi:hypothetical protein
MDLSRLANVTTPPTSDATEELSAPTKAIIDMIIQHVKDPLHAMHGIMALSTLPKERHQEILDGINKRLAEARALPHDTVGAFIYGTAGMILRDEPAQWIAEQAKREIQSN